MSSESSAVLLGTIGWLHPSWRGVFYPDDLPDDWQLAYYNTQFRSVFLPHADWSMATDAQLAQWVQDSHPGFRFVLESGPSPAAAGRAAAILGERLGMIAQREDPRLLWFDAGTDLKALAQEIGQRDKPIYLFSLDADLSGLQRVDTLVELLGW
jgi:hypothetical protein